MLFTGDFKYLINNHYELDESYEYYYKTIKNNKTNSTLTCYINIYSKKVSFVGDLNNKKFFDLELKDYTKPLYPSTDNRISKIHLSELVNKLTNDMQVDDIIYSNEGNIITIYQKLNGYNKRVVNIAGEEILDIHVPLISSYKWLYALWVNEIKIIDDIGVRK